MSLIIFIFLVCLGIVVSAVVYNSISSTFTWNPADEFQIQDLLKSYDKLSEYKSGNLLCIVCGENLSYMNIGPLIENDEKENLEILCNNPECIIIYFDSQETVLDDSGS